MLKARQWKYVNADLDDEEICAYYRQNEKGYDVIIDSKKCKMIRLPVYNLKFDIAEKANLFAQNYITYDKRDFNVFVVDKQLFIEATSANGSAKIDCGQNKEMAKKLVKTFRKQLLEHCYALLAEDKKEPNKDFKGLKF